MVRPGLVDVVRPGLVDVGIAACFGSTHVHAPPGKGLSNGHVSEAQQFKIVARNAKGQVI